MQWAVRGSWAAAPRRAAVAVVGAFGFLVGATWAGSPSAWYDEAATLSAVQRPVGELLDLLGHVDAVHGLYYLCAKGWAGLAGDSVASLRLLSALGLGVAAALTVGLVDRLATPRTALVAGIAVVLLPGISWAGVEARSFAWSAALAVGSTYVLVLARERRRVGWWVAYAGVLTASGWWFLFSMPMTAVHGIALLLADRRLPRGWVAAVAVATVGTVPMVRLALGQREQISHIDLSHDELALHVLGGQAFTGPAFSSRDEGAWIVAGAATAVLVTFAAACVVVRRRRLDPHDQLLLPLAWAWAVVPTVAVAGPHLWGAQLYQVRYLTYSVPAVAILVAAGLSTYTGVLRNALAALVVLAAAPGLVWHHLPQAKSGEDYRGLAALAETSGAGAVVFSVPGSRGIQVAYPAPFQRAEDLVLRQSAVASDTLFGVNSPPRSLRTARIAGQNVLHFHRTGDASDPYAQRLRRLGCRSVATSVRHRFSATVFDC